MSKINERICASWAAKYPFTEEAKEYIRLFVPSLEELADEELKHVWEYALNRAINSVKGKPIIKWELDEDELVATSFPLSLAIIKATKNPIIFSKFANGEAKRAYLLLLNETPENLVHISNEVKFPVEYIHDGNYRVYFVNYLEIALKFADRGWKLANNYLHRGYVTLNHKRVCRLLSEKVREYMIDRLTASWEVLDKRLVELAKKLLDKFGTKIQKFEEKEIAISKEIENFPPCMKRIYELVVGGGNPSHTARFALTTFMLRVGYQIDEIVRLFGRAADFNERIARYQVEHIAGERGGRKKYFVPSCEKMRLYGLCSPDDRCKFIKNPIQYPLMRKGKKK